MSAADASEIHLLKALFANKRTKDEVTGQFVVYDDDKTTPLVTIDVTDDGQVLTLTPTFESIPAAADPGAELHLVKAFLTNLATFDRDTGQVVAMDDDGVTPLLTLDNSTTAGVQTVEPAP